MNKNILIIEDDKYLTDDLSSILELFDYNVKVLNNADDAAANLNDFKNYDIILLDIMMRTDGILKMNGFKESGEAIYALIRNVSKEIKVIIMSAMDKEDINIDFNDKNTFYIKKPFSGIEHLMGYIN